MNQSRQRVLEFASLFLGSSARRNLLARAWNTAVLWSWGFNVLRLASVLVLLPLLTRLPHSDFGFYYLLLSIVAITPLIDLGFSSSFERGIGYAMAGAKQLRAAGLPVGVGAREPNYVLFLKLIRTARMFYRGLTLLLLLLLGGAGTWVVSSSAAATSSPALAWAAWVVALVNACFEVYSSWWNGVLRGMNQVVTCTRILCLGYATKLVLSCLLLLSGGGVLSVFAAGLVSSAMIRSLSRRKVLLIATPQNPNPVHRAELTELLRILWPNSWRIGLQLVSTYIMALVLMLICKNYFALAGAGQYGFSLNIVAVIQAIASVWVTVKWPAIHQLRVRNEIGAIRRLFWARVWLQTFTFLVLAFGAITLIPVLLKVGGFKKDVLPGAWFTVLVVNAFLETQMIVWGTLLTTENKVPTLWPIVCSNALTVALVLMLLKTTEIGMGAFAVAPLISGALFNYWYWPRAGAAHLGSTWLRYMSHRQPAETQPGRATIA